MTEDEENETGDTATTAGPAGSGELGEAGDTTKAGATTGDAAPLGAPGRAVGRMRLAAAAVVVLLGGGAGTASALAGGSSGNSTPAAAVTSMLAAVSNGDALGVLDALDPGERNAIEPGLSGLVAQLKRLGILSGAASLSSLPGLSVHFDGVETSTRMLRSDLAAVSITSGSATASVDPASLPLGSFVTGLIGSRISSARPTSSRAALSTGRSSIVTVEVGGSWYVSLGYTVAADAAGPTTALPAASAAVPAPGADSPSDAVRSFIGDVEAFDLRAMIGDLPPDEMGALQSYAPLFLAKDQLELDLLHALVGVSATYSLETSPVAGGTLVTVGDLAATVHYKNETLRWADGCLTTSGTSSLPAKVCSNTQGAPAALPLPAAIGTLEHRLAGMRPKIGLVTVEENGRWYLSPTRSLLADLDADLAVLSPGDLDLIASSARALAAEAAAAAVPSSSAAPAGASGALSFARRLTQAAARVPGSAAS